MKICICTDEKNLPDANSVVIIRHWGGKSSKQCAKDIRSLWHKHWKEHDTRYAIIVSKETFKRFPSRLPKFMKKTKEQKKGATCCFS